MTLWKPLNLRSTLWLKVNTVVVLSLFFNLLLVFGMLKQPASQACKLFRATATQQPAPLSTFSNSPLSPPHVAHPFPQLAASDRSHQVPNSRPGIHSSSGSHSLCLQAKVYPRSPACALLQAATKLSAPCGSIVIISPGSDSCLCCSSVSTVVKKKDIQAIFPHSHSTWKKKNPFVIVAVSALS